MKYVRNLLFVCSTVLLYSGCYTELATVEQNDRDYAYDTDTTYDESPTTITNHYYLDDDYRRSRLRTSFHYYYPENTSWIGAYYNSYFNDQYWGMRQWSWTYDPWYGYYPSYYPTWGCQPYYDPWHPYYPIVYYPVYYPSQIYVNNSPTTIEKKHRADGPTHEGTAIVDRSRPIPTPSSSGSTLVTTSRERESTPINKVSPVKRPGGTRDETPWWKRKNSEQSVEARPVGKQRVSGTENVPEKQNQGQVGTRQPRYTPSPKPSVSNDESKPVERQRETRRPSYNPSPKPSAPSNDARPVERPRESRRESYNPPAQQSPPSASAPSRGGSNSGSSSSSGGRKRD